MRSCDEIVDLISAALDGALTPDEQTALDEHLAACPACSALFADLRALHITVSELDEISAPAGFSARVMSAIAANPAQEQTDNIIPFPTKKISRTPWKKVAASAAVVAVVALGAISLPGQLGGNTMMKSAADMAAPAAAPAAEPECAAPAEAPAEFMMDTTFSAASSAAGENTSAAQKFASAPGTMDSPSENSSLPAPKNDSEDSVQSIAESDATEVYEVCGILLQNEAPDKFISVRTGADGAQIYTVSADSFFSYDQTLCVNEDSLAFDAVISPDSEVGLIVVQPN